MKVIIYKKIIPSTVDLYEATRQKACDSGYKWTNDTLGYMWFEKIVKENKEQVYIGGESLEEITEELNQFILYWNHSFKESRKLTEDLLKAYKLKRTKYNADDVEIAFRNYIEAKKDSEAQYRLTPIKFLTQRNGLINYL